MHTELSEEQILIFLPTKLTDSPQMNNIYGGALCLK